MYRRHRFGIWCEGRSISVKSLQCLVFGVKGDRSFILCDRSLIRNKKGRSIFMGEGRSQFVESSQCLVFAVRGDRS
ncbi:hypothetical protein [Microcoleus sp. Pol10D4]|uniref:hypothetical protein n=1 Tax=Microcoleus sp. Pol10D4 TaxID=3055387 RepID=UPI002FCFF3FE